MRGAVLIMAAMLGFSAADAVAKRLVEDVSPMALVWARFAVLLVSVVPIAIRPAHWHTRRPPLQALRAVSLVASAFLFIHGLRGLPQAEATALSFSSPFFVTVLAAIVLREKVSPFVWGALILGFAGVLVVLRPGASLFGVSALLPLASSVAWACGVVCTRKLGADDTMATTMLHTAAIGLAVTTIVFPVSQLPALMARAPEVMAMAVLWCGAQWLSIAAYRASPAAELAPFTYSQLVWATLIGMTVFAHIPDPVSLLGIAMVLVSGVLAAMVSRVRRIAA